ncbi:uncharacterized protein ACIBXB_011084 [Morphnus guianensis]
MPTPALSLSCLLRAGPHSCSCLALPGTSCSSQGSWHPSPPASTLLLLPDPKTRASSPTWGLAHPEPPPLAGDSTQPGAWCRFPLSLRCGRKLVHPSSAPRLSAAALPAPCVLGGNQRCSPGRTRWTLKIGDRTLLPCVPSLLASGERRHWGSGSAARPPGPAARGSPVTWKGRAVEDASATGREPSAAPGVSPELDCSCAALPRSRYSAAVGGSSSVRPAPTPAGFKSQPVGPAARLPDSSTMPGERTLLLALLALLAELPPTLAQQHRAGYRSTAPAVTPAPRRAPRRRWPPAILPVPGKAGECPAGGSGAPHPPRLYCLSDHSCPGAEKCCQSGQVRTCLLPTAESPGYCPRAGSASAVRCGMSCHNDTACSPGEKCCTRSCCARCVHAEPGKAPWVSPCWAEDATGQPSRVHSPPSFRGKATGTVGPGQLHAEPQASPLLQPNPASARGSAPRGAPLPAPTAVPMTGTAPGTASAASPAAGWPVPPRTQVQPHHPSCWGWVPAGFAPPGAGARQTCIPPPKRVLPHSCPAATPRPARSCTGGSTALPPLRSPEQALGVLREGIPAPSSSVTGGRWARGCTPCCTPLLQPIGAGCWRGLQPGLSLTAPAVIPY